VDKWDLDSIGYYVNFFNSATITYKRHNSNKLYTRKVKFRLLEYLFMDKNIHLVVKDEMKKLHTELKNENMTLMANSYHKQNQQQGRLHHELYGS